MQVVLRLTFIALFALMVGCGIGLQAVSEPDTVIPDDDDDAVGDDDDSSANTGDDDDSVGDDDDSVGDDDDSVGDDDDAANSGGACTAVTTLSCDQQISASTMDPGATNVIDEWACTGWANTGPELAYEFSPTEDMEVTISFQSMQSGEDLDLYVTADSGIGCHSDDCIAAGDNDATFNVVNGSTYYVLVDGYQGSAGTFVLNVDCNVTAGDDDDSVGDDDDSVGDDDDSVGDDDDSVATEDCTNGTDDDGNGLVDCDDAACAADPACQATVEDCTNGVDDDGNGLVDCDDTACAADPACTSGGGGATCAPGMTLTDGSTDSWNNGGAGSTNAVSTYNCVAWDESGPEYAYQFTATTNGTATVDVSVTGWFNLSDLDVFVLNGAGGSCDPMSCETYGDSTASWTVTPGSVWYIVVDGFQGDTSNYDISLSVASSGGGSTTETSCTDGLDDDGDGDIDCADSDCASDPACTSSGPVCVDDFVLSCGSTDSWATTSSGATNVVTDYSCFSFSETGPEYTYSFTPASATTATVSLSNLGSNDLDIIVLDGASGTCSGSNCLTWGDTSTSFSANAGQTYYLVVEGFLGDAGSYDIDVSCSP